MRNPYENDSKVSIFYDNFNCVDCNSTISSVNNTLKILSRIGFVKEKQPIPDNPMVCPVDTCSSSRSTSASR